MNRHRFSTRSGFTWIELVVVVIVIGVLLALIPSFDVGSREAARRMQCQNQLKQIALAIHNYGQSHKVLPPGTICDTAPIQPSNQYDVWAEAGKTGPGHQGASFLLAALPYMEGDTVATQWDYGYGVSDATIAQRGVSNFALATTDIKGLYCPTRRSGVRPGVDNAMMLSTSWTGGGTDYGGCAGRHAAFTPATGYNLCDATMFCEPSFYPAPFKGKEDDTAVKRWGIFGRVNVSTTFAEVRDGLSNTMMIGELQRITDVTPGSKDGWAIGGPATLFTTGAMFRRNGTTLAPALPKDGGMVMNNGFFGSPGSDHAGGANYGMGDGSVRFLTTSIDPTVFALLGSMASGVQAKQPD